MRKRMRKKKIKQIHKLKNRPQFNQNNLQHPELQENSTNSTWSQGNKITMKKMVEEYPIGAKAEIELTQQ